MKLAALILFLSLAFPAFAEDEDEAAKPPEPVPEVTKHNLNIEGIGDVTLTVIDDPHPQPVETPMTIQISLKCQGSKVEKKVGEDVTGCGFESAQYDKKLRSLIVTYLRNVEVEEGVLKCKASHTVQRRLSCAQPKAPLHK